MEGTDVVDEVIDDEQDNNTPEVLDFIPIQLDESYEDIQLDSVSGSSKVKYYKQTYRPAWEKMPDFKGWLRPVPLQPTRAFCVYCQKSLHAHRLSLLKHTCTIKHQKFTQLHQSKKIKRLVNTKKQEHFATIIVQEGDREELQVEDAEEEEDLVEPIEDNLVEDYKINDMTTKATIQANRTGALRNENSSNDFQDESKTSMPKRTAANVANSQAPNTKPPISTSVTDSTDGTPVAGLQVTLYKLIEGRWTYINEGLTNVTGRCVKFVERDDFLTGRYKLHFDVDRYFESRRQNSMFPFVEVIFDCVSPNDSYNIPLLLSPYAYTVHRA